jgi:hypothetical protein
MRIPPIPKRCARRLWPVAMGRFTAELGRWRHAIYLVFRPAPWVQVLARQHAQPLGDIRTHGHPQARFIASF